MYVISSVRASKSSWRRDGRIRQGNVSRAICDFKKENKSISVSLMILYDNYSEGSSIFLLIIVSYEIKVDLSSFWHFLDSGSGWNNSQAKLEQSLGFVVMLLLCCCAAVLVLKLEVINVHRQIALISHLCWKYFDVAYSRQISQKLQCYVLNTNIASIYQLIFFILEITIKIQT